MIYAVTVSGYLGPKLKLVVQKHLATLGVASLEATWSSSSNGISQVKGYSDRKQRRLLPLVTLALSGPEETLQWLLSQLLRYSSCRICGNTDVVMLRRNICTGLIVVRNILRIVHRHSGGKCFPQWSFLGRHSTRLLWLHLGGIRSKQGFNGEELDNSLGCHQVYPWCISTLTQW